MPESGVWASAWARRVRALEEHVYIRHIMQHIIHALKLAILEPILTVFSESLNQLLPFAKISPKAKGVWATGQKSSNLKVG